MKQNNDHMHSDTIELDDEIAHHVTALKSEQLTEDDFQRMESNLQRMIVAQGHQEERNTAARTDEHAEQPLEQKATVFEQLKSLFSTAFSWQPLRLASSMGAVMAVVLSLVFMGAPTKSAFAAVLSEMQLVSSMFFSSRIEAGGMHLMDINVYHQVPNLLRIETLPKENAKEGAMINVMNLEQGEGVLFFPAQKMATPFNFDADSQTPSEKNDPLYWYQQLQDFKGEPSEYLAKELIDGVLAEGFVIKDNGAKLTVWANVESHLPVKLIVTLDRANDKSGFELVTNLKYNQTFDDALFSLEIADDFNIAVEDANSH